ncbi:MAG: [FeFe] hydrogenase H-cluster maturation GTPase HydF [Bacteroidales bacterium]|nr:[FeFe] hydrogenase H-cluster maturation GTPase HydF [Bacteroidales bacterium]
MKGRENKPHIGIFGRRNNGKSSLINAIVGQDLAIVDSMAGTTTDPVKKSIEIFGIGPVVLIDTAGIDDVGEVGQKRIQKSLEVLKQIDLALLVITNRDFGEPEEKLVKQFEDYAIPYLVVNNKCDTIAASQPALPFPVCDVSAKTREGIDRMIEEMVKIMPPSAYISHSLLGDLIGEGDTVVLVTPIDTEAPEGRLILPQVQMIRDVLDHDAISVVLKEDLLRRYLDTHEAPKLVITDSQMFSRVAPLVPEEVPLTGFSIVLAHHKGDFIHYLEGTPHIDQLQDGDRVLMLESCTHRTSCDDIGRHKLPAWIQRHTGKQLHFDFVAGLDAIPDIKQYAMVIQCGGCMITHRQLINRLKPAVERGIPVSNYGMAIAYLNGIFDRAVKPFVQRPPLSANSQ